MKLTPWLAGAALIALAACSSGGDSGTPPTNEAPTITFATAALAVPKAVPVNLTVNVSDADADPLTITWDITRGALTAQNNSKTVMRWSTPSGVGADTVTVRVTDGSVTRSVTAVIKVGTLFTTPTFSTNFIKANSPYIIRPSGNPPVVNITGGETTTIEAGTELYIDTQAAHFNVLGELDAHGTSDEPIVIRPNSRLLSCAGTDRGWWDGFLGATDDAVPSDGFVDFEYVEVWYAQTGVRLSENASAVLRNCKFRCSGDAGIQVEGRGAMYVFDSQITDGLIDGIVIAAVTSLPDSVHVEGCNIAFNGNAGIRMDLQDTLESAPIIVQYNEIEFNDSHGIMLSHAVFPQIHFNSFRGNGDETVSNLFLTSGYPDPVSHPVLNVTCNYWGSAASSQATIDASIWDLLDTSTVHARVDSDPWLNASPITTPPSCTP